MRRLALLLSAVALLAGSLPAAASAASATPTPKPYPVVVKIDPSSVKPGVPVRISARYGGKLDAAAKAAGSLRIDYVYCVAKSGTTTPPATGCRSASDPAPAGMTQTVGMAESTRGQTSLVASVTFPATATGSIKLYASAVYTSGTIRATGERARTIKIKGPKTSPTPKAGLAGRLTITAKSTKVQAGSELGFTATFKGRVDAETKKSALLKIEWWYCVDPFTEKGAARCPAPGTPTGSLVQRFDHTMSWANTTTATHTVPFASTLRGTITVTVRATYGTLKPVTRTFKIKVSAPSGSAAPSDTAIDIT